MKKESVRIFALMFLGLIMISFVANFVAAIPASSIADAINNAFTKISGPTLFEKVFGKTITGESIWNLALTKFLVFGMLLLIIVSVLEYVPIVGQGTGKGKTAIRWLLAIIISYLSIIYIAPEELYAALVSYGAMGITLTSIIPFIIIFGITWELTKNPNPAKILLQKIIIWAFVLYLGYRISVLMWFPGKLDNVWKFALPIYIPIFGVLIIYASFNATIRQYLFNTRIAGYVESSKVMSKEEALADAAMLRKRANVLAEVTGETEETKKLIETAKRLEKIASGKME
ncbi:hypothetical protein HYW76_00355 [Candidatus Pacearchaeota archaeon]|nr:hypothetical protein [Candidatus Pacearchaeota archaeon]